jgi:hypothetical protein
MNSTRILANFFALALIAGLATGLIGQREVRIQAQAEHVVLEQQLQTLRSIAAENIQLSNLVARARALKALPADESRELLRLRAEVSALRQKTAELGSVLNENQQAHAAPDRNSRSRSASALKATPDYWPRDSWSFAGFATPDAALQSSILAADSGDLKAVLAATTGPLRETIEKDLATKSETEVLIRMMDEVAGAQAIRILSRTVQPDGSVVISAAFDGRYDDTHTARLLLQKVGDDWKIAGAE